MKLRKTLSTWVVFWVIFVCCACAAKSPQAKIESAAGFQGYAVTYPGRLNALATQFESLQTESRQIIESFDGFADQLKEAENDKVEDLYKKADAFGRSTAYVGLAGDDAAIRAFFEENRNDIAGRIGAIVKQAGTTELCSCDLEVGGKIAYSLKESVNRRLERRVKLGNEARLVLERYKQSLGKKNSSALADQVDSISRVAYIVSVALTDLGLEIDSQEREARKVRKTIDRAIEDEQELLESENTQKTQKKAAENRIQKLEAAAAEFESSVQRARAIAVRFELDIETLGKEYDAAFDHLCDSIKTYEKPVEEAK
jgi:flagellar motility protein MotE (MotC chaperone)